MQSLKNQILELRSQGKTYPQIAELLNCSKGTISFHCNKASKDKILQRNREYKRRLKEKRNLQENLSSCLYCNSLIPQGNTFCNSICQHSFSVEKKYQDWVNGKIEYKRSWLRKALSRLYGYKCSICNITTYNFKPIVLQVDHINGNAGDNTISNLRLICPNCHSQTDTFCGRNRGKGRNSLGINRNN